MNTALLSGLALARGGFRPPMPLKHREDWWSAAVATGALGVGVRGDRLDSHLDPSHGLNWQPVSPADEARAILLSSTPGAVRVALMGATDEDVSRWVSLRTIGDTLPDSDVADATAAVALATWHARHPHCPRCGAATRVHEAGWARICNGDGSVHYPRNDPAVIVLVRDAEDRALLGRRSDWPLTWYSTLAGFVEAGESAEQAVVRELQEEAGIEVLPDSLRYRGSQPWPFPSSLMLGYHAWVADSAPVTSPDLEEIAEAIWVSRSDLAQAADEGTIRVPPPVSIARHLIEDWYGGTIPTDWARA